MTYYCITSVLTTDLINRQNPKVDLRAINVANCKQEMLTATLLTRYEIKYTCNERFFCVKMESHEGNVSVVLHEYCQLN